MTRYETLAAKSKEHEVAALAIARKSDSENRDYTDAERQAIALHLTEVKSLKHQMDQTKADEAWRTKLAGLGSDVPEGSFVPYSTGGRPVGGSGWAKTVAGRLVDTARRYGVKSISTGGIDVPSVVEPGIALPSRPTRLLDLIPSTSLTGNEFAYPKQVARTNNAATVADNAAKPVSTYTFEEVIDRARVIAHLSEPIPLRFFEDHADLSSVLDGQMYDDLMVKVEDLVASGDGTGENWTGILNTSGILAQSYTTNLLTTLRKARTALEGRYENPNCWIFAPADAETLDLLTDSQNRFYGNDEINNLLGNVRRVSSAAVPPGTALLGDFGQARLYIRESATLMIDRSGDLFSHNQARIRVEMRAGFAVLRPQAFIAVDLTA